MKLVLMCKHITMLQWNIWVWLIWISKVMKWIIEPFYMSSLFWLTFWETVLLRQEIRAWQKVWAIGCHLSIMENCQSQRFRKHSQNNLQALYLMSIREWCLSSPGMRSSSVLTGWPLSDIRTSMVQKAEFECGLCEPFHRLALHTACIFFLQRTFSSFALLFILFDPK